MILELNIIFKRTGNPSGSERWEWMPEIWNKSIMSVNSEGPGETAWMHKIVSAFAGRMF